MIGIILEQDTTNFGFNEVYSDKKQGLVKGVFDSKVYGNMLMNNRPRKCLGWKTPFEVFAELTGRDYFLKRGVALIPFSRSNDMNIVPIIVLPVFIKNLSHSTSSNGDFL